MQGTTALTIRSGVVPNHIKAELAARDVVQVQVSHEHTLPVAQRPSKGLPERADDDTPARNHDVVRCPAARVGHRVVLGVILLLGVLARREDKAAALARDVVDRVLPIRAAVDRRRTVELGALRVVVRTDCSRAGEKSKTRWRQLLRTERHVVLPVAAFMSKEAGGTVECAHQQMVADTLALTGCSSPRGMNVA